MLQRLARWRPSHAVVVAYLALFVALGGSSFAVVKVGTRQIVNNSVSTKDLKNNDVRGKDVRNSSLGGADVGSNKLTGADIDESKLGAVPSAANSGNADNLDGKDSAAFKVTCPSGTLLVGGSCIETALRAAASYEGALDACGDAGRLLASPTEVRALSRQPGITLAGGEETDVMFNNGGTFGTELMGESGSLSTSNDTTTPRTFRCVTGPSN
jgi:hypothetical protein